MGKRIEFACLEISLLLVYEQEKPSGQVLPIVCFNKVAKTIVPFEKQNFENLQGAIEYICWQLTSAQIISLASSLEGNSNSSPTRSVPRLPVT
jgi:hypothetical protein